MRIQTDTYYDKMSDNAVKDRLKELNEFDSTSSIEILRDRLKNMNGQGISFYGMMHHHWPTMGILYLWSIHYIGPSYSPNQ